MEKNMAIYAAAAPVYLAYINHKYPTVAKIPNNTMLKMREGLQCPSTLAELHVGGMLWFLYSQPSLRATKEKQVHIG